MQGWAGMACLPRELVSLEYRNVTKALASPLTKVGSNSCQEDGKGTYTIKTVGIRPVKEVLKLREESRGRQVPDHVLQSSSRTLRLPLQSKTWELEFEADIQQSCTALNVVLQHSASELASCNIPPITVVFSFANITLFSSLSFLRRVYSHYL